MSYHERLLHGSFDWPDHEELVSVSAERGVLPAETYGKPIWRGETEPITLLVNAEFGDGDTIQFWRFMPSLNRRVKKVFLRCNKDFETLFHDFRIEVVGKGDPLPEFDKIIHMMALPKALGLKEITGVQYLFPSWEEKPAFKIDDTYLPKTGLCWAGNPFNPRDRFRSVPVDLFSGFQSFDPTLKFVSLNNIYKPPEWMEDVRRHMTNWNRTAWLIQKMGLVITVDTSIAHLAGALGKEVWMLTPDQEPDWRWGLEGTKTHWYDSMTLYRREGSWAKIMERVLDDFRSKFLSRKS